MERLDEAAKSVCEAIRLRLDRRVGDGTFKAVYRAFDESNSAIALKLTRPSHYSQRSERECQVLSQCDHPSIAKIIDFGEHSFEGGRVYYSLEEYLAGGTLTQRITNALFPIIDGLRLARALVEALSHLDQLHRKCVHRDIKPDNVMFREPGDTPVLVDFGLVRVLNDASLTQTWLAHGPGTPYYASPEQLNNQKALIDWRCDQFSLGVTASLACFGVHPYQRSAGDQDRHVTLMRVARRDPPMPWFRELVEQAGFAALIAMTMPWPNQRVRFHDELLDLLR